MPLVEIFTGPAPIDWIQEATMVKVRIFFLRGSFKCMIIILPTFWSSAPAFKFSWQLTCKVTRDDARAFVPTIPRRRRAFTVSWNIEVFRSQQFCEQYGHFFLPGAPVTSFLSQPISTVIPVTLTFNKTKPALSSNAVATKALSNVQLVPVCVPSGNIHNAISRHLDENRTKYRRTGFSMNTTQESKQRSTNWWRWHLGDRQQQPRRVFTNVQKRNWGLNVYICPWPPGWSFLRRIYTSRGSERVKQYLWAVVHTVQGKIEWQQGICLISSWPQPFLQMKKRTNLPSLLLSQSFCFRTWIDTGVDSKDKRGSKGQYREQWRGERS